MMTHEQQLLTVARRMPEAGDLVRFMDQVFEFWRDALTLPDMDRDIFVGRLLASQRRYDIPNSVGLAYDPIWLAAVVCAAAHLNLDMEQIRSLRRRIGDWNSKIVTNASVEMERMNRDDQSEQ